ncbi:MAG: hypothetical protein P4L82_07150 [Ancalomicrobiaceae bacterium]|nr:hypothetical protein [Ancalomicrobiaceae bacterium]
MDLEDDISQIVRALEGGLLRLTNDVSQPNLNKLMIKLRNIDAMALSLKYFGYELAATLARQLPVRTDLTPIAIELRSKPSTQADMESDWVAYWCGQLKVPVVFHRKLWEFAYALQALYQHGMLRPGTRGLGFGCGEEPLPSYLTSLGLDITITDLQPAKAHELGWVETHQSTRDLDHAFKAELVDRATFDAHAELRFVDMNAIPDDLTDYDFCWSICALEHLGSIRLGLDFIVASLDTLKPGGVAVHTTEFNFMNDAETVDNWPTVLFQKRHFSELADLLRAKGHHVAALDFSVGNKPLDKFIDVPPWLHDWDDYMKANWGQQTPHLKLSIDGFASTCFGLIITKRP